MKTLIYLVIVMFVLVLFVFGCEKEKGYNKQLTLTGKLISNSACKSGLKSTFEILGTPDNLSCVDYSFDDANNKLTIKHINAAFNCCPDSLYCNVSLSSGTIIISECEAKSQCNCNCLYDLDLEINGVDTKKYQIKFIEPYSGDQAKIIFEIDLTKDKSGSFCVTRKLYPWGMDSMNK